MVVPMTKWLISHTEYGYRKGKQSYTEWGKRILTARVFNRMSDVKLAINAIEQKEWPKIRIIPLHVSVGKPFPIPALKEDF